MDNRPRQQGSLLLATRQIANPAIGHCPQPEPVQRLLDQRIVVALWVGKPAEVYITPRHYKAPYRDGEAPIDLASLGQIGHSVMASPHRPPIDADGAGVVGLEPRQRLEQRAFAGTVGTNQGRPNPGGDVEGGAIEGVTLAGVVDHPQVADGDGVRPRYRINVMPPTVM